MDEPNAVKKGINTFESGRVASVCVSSDGFVLGKVGTSVKKKLYDVKVPHSLHLFMRCFIYKLVQPYISCSASV